MCAGFVYLMKEILNNGGSVEHMFIILNNGGSVEHMFIIFDINEAVCRRNRWVLSCSLLTETHHG